MWEIIKKNKFSVGLVAVILVAVIAYSIFMIGGDEEAVQEEGQQEVVSDIRVGSEIFDLVDQLRQISFDESLFENPVYQSLRQFGYQPILKSSGRVNPFAPLGPNPGKELISVQE